VSPLDGVNGVRHNVLARIRLSMDCRVPGARGRSGSAALSLCDRDHALVNREPPLRKTRIRIVASRDGDIGVRLG
jgi:hypothetical protein